MANEVDTTLLDNLNSIKNSKADIKQALIDKGQNPTNVFADYAQLIGDIQTGEDLSEELSAQEAKLAQLESILDNKTAGANVKLNVFTQTTEPTNKNGLWLQTDKTAEHYKSDDSIYFSGSWSNGADIPYTFSQGSAVAIGTDIYIFGGVDNKTTAYKYNTLTNTYTQLTNIPYDFYRGSAVSVGTDIYLLGGYGVSGNYNNYKYNTLTDTYTQLTNIPYWFYDSSAVSVGTDIYLLGTNSGNSYSKYNYKYNTLTDTYTQLTNIPFYFKYGSAVSVGTDIYLLGGSSNQINYKYNILTDTYTQLTNMPSGFGFAYGGAVAFGTDIYLFGGNSNSSKACKYNISSDTYTQLNYIPYQFYNGSVVIIDTDIYMFGGGGNNTATRIYHIQTKTYDTDNTVIIAQGRVGIGKTYNMGYVVELFNTTFDENFQPIYGLVDAWFYTAQDGIMTDIPTYYGDGTQWIKFKN